MSKIYRIVNNYSGKIIGDFIIESEQATLLSSTHKLELTESLPENLESLKLLYKEEVNKKTAKVRSRFITLEPGQDYTYSRKTQEALAYVSNGSPVDTDYPYLLAESNSTEREILELATSILQKISEIDSVNIVIEAQRKRGEKQIGLSSTLKEAKEVRDFAIASLDMHGK